MSYKTLIFSDLHLHEWSYGSYTLENGFNSRLWDQHLALEQILNAIDENEVESLFFAGDFFHTPGKVSTQELWVANNFFKEIRSRNWLTATFLVGNHDMANRSGTIHSLSQPFGMKITPNTYWSWEEKDNFVVNALGYTTDDKVFERYIKQCEKNGGMMLMHQGVSGVPLSSGFVLDERLTPDMIPSNCRAFTGHYHYHQQVSPNLTVIGNLTAHNWNDIDQRKGYILWDADTDEMEWVDTKTPEFITYDPERSVENCFVRYTEEVKPADIEDVRQELIGQGALTVEFTNVFKISNNDSKDNFKSDVFDVDTYIRGLTEDMEPRRVEVDQEIREGRYEL